MHGTMPFAWTEERRETVRQRWSAGESATAIAKALGTTKNAVISLIHRSGFKPPDSKPHYSHLTEERISLIRGMRREGWTIKRIAAKFGVDRSTIGKHVLKLGMRTYRTRRTELLDLPFTPAPPIKRIPGKTRRGDALRMAVALRGPRISPEDKQSRPADAIKAFGNPCNILDLTHASCRWPINDPKPSEAFAHLFCNAVALPGLPYCRHHSALAFSSRAR